VKDGGGSVEGDGGGQAVASDSAVTAISEMGFVALESGQW
jgi:hypothetical protein